MNIKHKLAAILASLLTSAGVVIGIATPAQAWSYCNNPAEGWGVVWLYPGQGYCGSRLGIYPPQSVPSCVNLQNWPGANEFAAAWSNKSGRTATLFASTTCTGTQATLSNGTSDADLYPNNLYHLGSSIRFF